MAAPTHPEFDIRGVNHLALVGKDMARAVEGSGPGSSFWRAGRGRLRQDAQPRRNLPWGKGSPRRVECAAIEAGRPIWSGVTPIAWQRTDGDLPEPPPLAEQLRSWPPPRRSGAR